MCKARLGEHDRCEEGWRMRGNSLILLIDWPCGLTWQSHVTKLAPYGSLEFYDQLRVIHESALLDLTTAERIEDALNRLRLFNSGPRLDAMLAELESA